MDNKKDDKYYIEKVLEHINVIISYTNGKNYAEFTEEISLVDATMFRLIQMIENLNHLSEKIRIKYSNIKWGMISGFRNGIVHNYGKTDYFIVYEIISKDIYELKSILEEEISS